MRIDSNTRGHLLWFYFSVQNQQKLGKITMNICNFSKSKTLYKEVKLKLIIGIETLRIFVNEKQASRTRVVTIWHKFRIIEAITTLLIDLK